MSLFAGKALPFPSLIYTPLSDFYLCLFRSDSYVRLNNGERLVPLNFKIVVRLLHKGNDFFMLKYNNRTGYLQYIRIFANNKQKEA